MQDEAQLQLYNNDWMKKFRQFCRAMPSCDQGSGFIVPLSELSAL